MNNVFNSIFTNQIDVQSIFKDHAKIGLRIIFYIYCDIR